MKKSIKRSRKAKRLRPSEIAKILGSEKPIKLRPGTVSSWPFLAPPLRSEPVVRPEVAKYPSEEDDGEID